MCVWPYQGDGYETCDPPEAFDLGLTDMMKDIKRFLMKVMSTTISGIWSKSPLLNPPCFFRPI